MNTQKQLAALINEYRDQCLWFLLPDYYPTTAEESLRVLDLIARYGDRAGYQRACEIRSWLSLDSKATS